MGSDAADSASDWYESDVWDEPARELFRVRLARARSQRPSYLRIKGTALTRAGDVDRVRAGRELLCRVVAEYADEPGDVSAAHVALAESMFATAITLGRNDICGLVWRPRPGPATLTALS